MAVALDGSLLGSVGMYDGVEDVESAIRAAVEHGGRVFVGVELHPDEIADVKERLDDAAWEALMFVLGASPQRRKPKGAAR